MQRIRKWREWTSDQGRERVEGGRRRREGGGREGVREGGRREGGGRKGVQGDL